MEDADNIWKEPRLLRWHAQDNSALPALLQSCGRHCEADVAAPASESDANESDGPNFAHRRWIDLLGPRAKVTAPGWLVIRLGHSLAK
mmetsp:Transcript_17703/g.28406  ORF Transcript_17703/g.28406 Transcript_17703/m.28406 type:complete len:88 (+) Transcript_17703:739-1002(+)